MHRVNKTGETILSVPTLEKSRNGGALTAEEEALDASIASQE